MSEETKDEELQEEVETTGAMTEEKVEEQPQGNAQNGELQKALERAEGFENKYLRVHVEMQDIQRRASEERQQLQKYRSQDLAKTTLPNLNNLERALAVGGLADDVKKDLGMTRDSLIRTLNEEDVEEVVVENSDHNLHVAAQILPADEEHPTDGIAQVFQGGYKLRERLPRPAMVVVYS